MKGYVKILVWLTAVIVAGCKDGEQRRKNLPADGIYFSYRIWGEEGKEEVTCMLQFRAGGPNGAPVILQAPAGVELDGEELKADSARLSGAFYEILKPLNQFKGRHSIVFIDAEAKRYKQEFDFIPFQLRSELPPQIQKEPFTIQLNDFPVSETSIRLTLVDTSFSTNDVNEIVSVENGNIKITKSMLDKLTVGPVILELYKEDEKSIGKVRGERGRLWISYGLRREFELID